MEERSTELQRRGFLPALRHRDFAIYYGGLVVSSFGNNFTMLAMSWQMYEMTGSPLQLGLLGLSRFVVTMPILLFGGLLADAVDRRKLMLRMQAGHLSVATVLLILSALGLLSPNVFYVATMFNAFFGALENPARQAIVPNMVPEEDLTNAMALNATQRSVSTIAGPPLAGILLGFIGPTANYAVSWTAWLVMLGVLAYIRPGTQVAGGRRGMSIQSLTEGFTYVWGHPILLCMMLLDFGANFFGVARTLLPVYASDILTWPGTDQKIGPQGFGFLSGASAIGSLTGGVLMSAIPQVRHAGIGALVGVSIFALCTIGFAFNTNFFLAWLFLAGEGLGDTISHVFRLTILQLNMEDRLRGRVTSVNMLFTNGGGPLGSFRAGAMAEWVGPPMAVFTGGLAVLGVVAIMGTSVPWVRRYVIEPAEAATAGASRGH